ncbi:MAG: hypothetical protein JWO06_2629, partial [Bacteroidota bacterium]|nr:hypothetical protein [Bacteroidota bacterium]
FFSTCYLLAFFLYTESAGNKRNKFLLLFFISVTAAVMTKGIAGLLFAPALFIFALFRKQVVSTLRNKYFYLGTLGFLVVVLGYYFLREHYNPGYLAVVSENELGGRFSDVNEQHGGDWNYYWTSLRMAHFSTWYWALPASLLLVWFLPNPKIKRALAFCILSSLCFLTVLSVSKTKLPWYDIPVYPMLACIVAIVVLQIGDILSLLKFLNRQWTLMVLIVIFSIQPTVEAFNYLKWQYDDLSNGSQYALSYYLRDAIDGKRDLKDAIFFFDDYCVQWRLYVKMLNDMGTGVDDQLLYGGNKFKVGQKLIMNHDEPEKFVESRYEYKILDEFYGVKYYELTGIKNKLNAVTAGIDSCATL